MRAVGRGQRPLRVRGAMALSSLHVWPPPDGCSQLLSKHHSGSLRLCGKAKVCDGRNREVLILATLDFILTN